MNYTSFKANNRSNLVFRKRCVYIARNGYPPTPCNFRYPNLIIYTLFKVLFMLFYL